MTGLIESVSGLLRSKKSLLRRADELRRGERYQSAYELYRRAADKGSVDAMLALARMHETGEGTPISLPHALEWYERAATLNDEEGLFGAGRTLMRLERVPRGIRSWYKEAAAKEPERAAELGVLLGAQIDIEDPYGKAREYLAAACAKGHGEAHYYLAELLVRGLGGPVDAERAHDLYVIAAAQGIAGAEFGLGELHRTGSGCREDLEIAQNWYNRAAAKGHVPAQLLAAQHHIIRGTKEDFARASDWLAKAAAGDAPHADFLLAHIALNAFPNCRDIDGAKHHLKRAASRGHIHALKQLARIYDEGLLDEPRDSVEAASLYKKVAESGDAEAQFIVGRMYARGEGLPANAASAARWFGRSAEAGHPIAQYNYALYLERGNGVNVDAEAAVLMLRQAAENGLASAQFKLGRDLIFSHSNDEDGLRFLKQAVKQNHIAAMALLGQFYARGERVAKDTGVARDFLQRAGEGGNLAAYVHLASLLHTEGATEQSIVALETAAAKGSADAEFALANLLLKGEGVDADATKGLIWLRAAADHGHVQALFDLGVRMCRGDDVKIDIEQGAALYQAAGEAGHIVGKYNYAALVLSGRVENGSDALAKRFLGEAARAGLEQAVQACETYQVPIIADDTENTLLTDTDLTVAPNALTGESRT